MKSLFQKFQPAILVLALMLFGQNSSIGQVLCRIKFVATANSGSTGVFAFAAMPADSQSILNGCFSPNATYSWNFGDGSSGTGKNITHTFSGTGNRYVCLTAQTTNNNGSVSFCDTITIDSIVTPNCFVVFSYAPALITLPLSYQFNPDVSNPNCFPPNTVYSWTWGDGTSEVSNGPGNFAIKTYANPGNYQVCFTATAPGLAPVSSCQNVNANYAGGNFNVSGMVQANNACLNSPVLVELISLTDSEQRATVLTNPDSCYYWFQVPAQPVRNWILKATPLQTNAYMPTYLGDVIFYNDATIFATNPPGQSNPVLNLVPNFWGDSINWDSTSNPFFGRASGTITGNGTTIVSTLGNYNLSTIFNASKAVVLILNAQNKPIGFAKVNADGTFITPNLPPGQYSLRVEAPKVPSQSVPFTITAGSNAQINFNATGSGVNTVTSVNKTIKSSELSIYPNPANDKISLKGVTGAVKIIDTKGQTVLETASRSNIEIAKLPSGIYTITGLNKANKLISARFVKH